MEENLAQNSKLHFFILALTGCLWLTLISGCTTQKEASNTVQKISPAPSPVKTPDKPTIIASYDIVEKWQIPDGENKRITIPADLQTEEGLLSVCDKIEQDVKNTKVAFVFGHRDAKSANIQKRFDKATAQEKKYLGENFILAYVKSPANGMHQCEVYVNGNQGGKKELKVY